MDWRNFIHSKNPVAAALLSKMGYSEKEKVQVKKEFLRMLVKMEINPAQTHFINGFFESYLRLNESEEMELMEEIKMLNQEESEQIFKLPNSWIEKGWKEGKEEGEKEVRRKIAFEMLKEGLTIELIAKITGLNGEEIKEIRDQRS